MTPIKKTFQYGSFPVTLETGEIARQADGAVLANLVLFEKVEGNIGGCGD